MVKKKEEKIDKVMNAIDKWAEEHGNNVMFFGSFVAFNKNSDIVEDRIICYGDKDILKISIDEFNKAFKKEKEQFINW